MPGKHAPRSVLSFYLSLARAVAGALAAVGVLVAVVLVLLNLVLGRGESPPSALPTVEGAPAASPEATLPTLETPTPSPTGTALAPGRVTVAVLNGTTRRGLAAATAERIRRAGYRVVDVGNAPRTEESTIFYRPGARAEALAFQERFPEFGVLQESTQTGQAMLRVVIGADFP
jgi:hypothetical protein